MNLQKTDTRIIPTAIILMYLMTRNEPSNLFAFRFNLFKRTVTKKFANKIKEK